MSDQYSAGATAAIDPVTVLVEVRDCTIVVSKPRLVVPRMDELTIRWQIDTEGWEFDGPGIGLEGARVEPDGARVAPGTQSIELTVNTLAASVTNYSVKVRRPKEVECVEIQTFGFSINTFAITPIGTCDLTIYVWHDNNNNKIHLSKLHAGAGFKRPMTIEWILFSNSFSFTTDGIETASQSTYTCKQIDESKPTLFFRSGSALSWCGQRKTFDSLYFCRSRFASCSCRPAIRTKVACTPGASAPSDRWQAS